MKISKLLILSCLFFSWSGYAQTEELFEEDPEPKSALNNQIKVNLGTLIWGTGSFNYERKVSKRWTVGLTANYRPKATAPFKSVLQDIFGDKNKDYLDNAFDIDLLEYSNWSVSPEVKVYLGKSNAFKGFYIAGFLKYDNLDIDYDYPLEFTFKGYDLVHTLPLKGDLRAWSGGVYVGYQWQLGEKWFLDWQIIGGNFGGGTLEVFAHQALSKKDQERITSFANEIQDQFSDVKYEVNGQGAKIWGSVPWAGLRTGLSIGFVF